MRSRGWRLRMGLMGGLLGAGLTAPAWGRQDPPPLPTPATANPNDPAVADPEGGQVLTRGPIHEAFAQPILFDPKPGPVVAKNPPAPIDEVPPDQQPEGENVQWIPGYWAWDEEKNDFLWISGVWRAVPPGRQWMPGYWNPVDGGFQWVPGSWAATDADASQAEYLPEPPASIEEGPTSPAPSPDATWTPGLWTWQDNQYAWRPGFWVNSQPGWLWTPAQYTYTPNGYLFNQGYWDYPLATRGVPFAPVAFSGQGYSQPGFRYTPSVALLGAGLLSNLFVRPAYHQYYFGDYFGQNSGQGLNGIYPYYAFHQSKYGYDPLYAYAAAQNSRTNPQWNQQLLQSYQYRRDHAEARPARTFSEFRRMAARPAAGVTNPILASNVPLARSFSALASTPLNGANSGGLRYRKLEDNRRQELSRQAAQVHQYGIERQKREAASLKSAPAVATGAAPKPQPRRVEMPRSPIGGAIARGEAARVNAPARPEHPQPQARPAGPPPGAGAGPGPNRHEPRFETPPPAHQAMPQPQPRVEGPNPGPAPGAGPRPNPGAGAGPRPGPGPKPGGGPGPKPGGGGGGRKK